ncbi:hypothetical protein SNE40_022996 [Patella caerulea]|uniref:SH3b domain-containing protein n=1 Tax=Patella caerulea TaxID=87958 RepID=A0AAN8G998_PATCE
MLVFTFILFCGSIFLNFESTYAANCACATLDVHVRSGAGTKYPILGSLRKTKCLTYRGNKLSADGYEWAHVTYNGQDGWAATKWIEFKACTVTSGCVCATTSVHVRSGAGTAHHLLGTLSPGFCLPYRGDKTTSGGLEWAHVEYDHASGWTASKWLTFKDSCSTGTAVNNPTTNRPSVHSSQQLPGCPHIVPRAQWGARTPKHADKPMPAVPQYVYVHHSASPPCTNTAACARLVRIAQDYYMDGHGWSDLGYTFMIGEDGNVYEGHGWGRIGAHTLHHNTDGLGFCVIGDFTSRVPNAAAINALKQLIDCGVKNGKIRSDYIIKGHRDVRATACPGTTFYQLIKTWPRYMTNVHVIGK